MKNINSMTAKNLISVIKDVVIIFGVLLLLAQFILPAPYNPSYLVKKALYKPTALCADETYIFTFPPSENSCSNHGGIVKMFLENLKEIDLKREQMSRE